MWDTPAAHLSALSKSTLIQTRVFPWRRSRRKKGKKKKKKMSTKKQAPSLPALWKKAWLWHLLFSFTWTLRKWTHFHTFQPLLRTARHNFTTHVTSSSVAGANGYHTREGWRASIPSHKNLQAVKFGSTRKSLSWSPAISVDAVTPVCSSGKYFLGVTHVRTVAASPARLICPPLLRRSGVCLCDTLHISNKKRWKSGERV